MTEKKNEKHDEVGHLFEITRRFRTAMLETIAIDGHLHGRPMAVIHVDEPDRAIWFMTLRDGEACAELAKDPRAMVTLQDDQAFVQWSGHASVVEDPAKVRALWTPALALWFPKGADDPAIVLIRVDADVGEYWDQSGMLKARTLVRRAKGAIRKQPPSPGEQPPEEHARVRFDGHGRS